MHCHRNFVTVILGTVGVTVGLGAGASGFAGVSNTQVARLFSIEKLVGCLKKN